MKGVIERHHQVPRDCFFLLGADGDMVVPVYVNRTLVTRYEICNISLNVSCVFKQRGESCVLRLWNAGRYERFFSPSLIYLDFYTKVEGNSRVTYSQDKSNLRTV